jgi:hypothetical protein
VRNDPWSGLRYALLFVAAAALALEVGALKPAPRAFVTALFVGHALLSAGTRRLDRCWPRDGLTALLWIGCFVASGISLCTSLALRAWPPVTPEGHRVMPLGQLFFGVVTGSIAGIVVATRGSLRHERRDRSRERLVLHGVGALLIVAILIGFASSGA